jgi:hypothetical protein
MCCWYQKKAVEILIKEWEEGLEAIHPVVIRTSNNPSGAAGNSIGADIHPRELRSAELDGNGLVCGGKLFLGGDTKLVEGSLWYYGEVAVVIRQGGVVFALVIAVNRCKQRPVVGGRTPGLGITRKATRSSERWFYAG